LTHVHDAGNPVGISTTTRDATDASPDAVEDGYTESNSTTTISLPMMTYPVDHSSASSSPWHASLQSWIGASIPTIHATLANCNASST
ncbi:hypothetical protein N1031_19075, partial [Herbiconiux moechotypicola]